MVARLGARRKQTDPKVLMDRCLNCISMDLFYLESSLRSDKLSAQDADRLASYTRLCTQVTELKHKMEQIEKASAAGMPTDELLRKLLTESKDLQKVAKTVIGKVS